MKNSDRQFSTSVARAKSVWGPLSRPTLDNLKELLRKYRFSVTGGHLQLLDGRWYVTHAGLLHIAQNNRCIGIQVLPLKEFCDPAACRWLFKATVYKSSHSKGFVGYGDANPSNVSSLVHGAEMRVAETRAVNRALRKAYGIGLCSVEELGTPRSFGSAPSNHHEPSFGTGNGHSNGQPRLRDRLCLLIRQHQLDAGLVKAYAAHYCGTPSLREASRESVEAFVKELAERAVKDRPGLLCQLNSYAQPTEVTQ